MRLSLPTRVIGRLKNSAAIGFALMTLVLSGTMAAGLSAPSFALAPRLAPIEEERAARSLEAAPMGVAQAERATNFALAQAPMTASAWGRRAYLEQLRTAKLGDQAQADLDMSYYVAPVGPDISPWRLRFMFENWPALTPALRLKAMNELSNFAHYHKGSSALAQGIRDPAGRFASELVVNQSYTDDLRNQQAQARPQPHND